jgi:hypothetical protein
LKNLPAEICNRPPSHLPKNVGQIPPPLPNWDNEKVALSDRCPFKRGSIQIKLSMTGQEKGDCLIEVTTLAGLTISKIEIHWRSIV